jgi:hypothetical protein
MAGRTRRPNPKTAETEAPVEAPEVVEVEAGTQTDQEVAAEAPQDEEADVATVTEETAEQPEVEVAAEAPEVEVPAEKPAEAPAEKAKTPDEYFTEFKDVVTAAIEISDDSTGTVPEASMDLVLTAYKALPNTAKKSEAKSWIADVMRETLMARDMGGATAYANINKAINEVGTRRASSAPARPTVSVTEGFVTRIVALALANKFTVAPEGLDDNWVDQFNEMLDKATDGQSDTTINAYKAYLAEHAEWAAKAEGERGDEPTEPEGVSQVLKDAAKIGQGKSVGARRTGGGARRTSGGGGGVRRDVKKHIEEFLDSVETGSEHPVAAISNFKSSEYPEGDASPGAVAARLFPADGKPSTVTGFEQVTGGGTRKIRKLAA